MGETAAVTDRRRSALNLNVLLAAVEAAPPVAAADVVGEALSEALDARDVSFLIADYSAGNRSSVSATSTGMRLPRLTDASAAMPWR
jgi:hypothetical protein